MPTKSENHLYNLQWRLADLKAAYESVVHEVSKLQEALQREQGDSKAACVQGHDADTCKGLNDCTHFNHCNAQRLEY